MGFDIFGLNAKNKKGEYFRNNVWGWRPLQMLIQMLHPHLSEKQSEDLGMNNGGKFNAKFADKLATELKNVTTDKDKFKVAHKNIMEALGVIGANKDGSSWYECTLEEFKENVLNFAEFCENSGGFEVD